MKLLILLVTAVLCLSASLASADVTACRTIEYSELKDTSTPDLIYTYCNYRNNSQYHQKMYPLMKQVRSQQVEAKEALEMIQQCDNELEKIRSVFKKRKLSTYPSCKKYYPEDPFK